MPVFKVPRTYVQVKRTEVKDAVYVGAEDPVDARQKVADGQFDEIADGGEETGHHEYGEIVSEIDPGPPMLSVGPVEEETRATLGRYEIALRLGPNGLLVKACPAADMPASAGVREFASGVTGGCRFLAYGEEVKEYHDELEPLFSDKEIGSFEVKLDRDPDGHLTLFVEAEDKEILPKYREEGEGRWMGWYVLPSNDSRYET